MSSKLHLGVKKYLLGDIPSPSDPRKPSGVLAEITPTAKQGKSIRRLVPIGPLGITETIEVPPGPLVIQVRLPSGELLTREVVLADGQESTVVLETRSSPHEWMSWPRFLSDTPQTPGRRERPAPHVANLPTMLWIRRRSRTIDLLPDRPWHEDIDLERSLLSCSFTAPVATVGERTFLAIGAPASSSTVLATIPLPWSVQGQTARVQVVIDFASAHAAGLDVNVLVHDPWLAPMLGYLESGDLAAAKQFEASVIDNAEDLLAEKAMNPIAAAAGAYLLLQTRALRRLHDWPQSLATRFDWLPDGAVIYATQLLRTRNQSKDTVRQALLTAAARGAPVFREGVQLIADGIRMLATYEAPASDPRSGYKRKRFDDTFEALSGWVTKLESATRPDTLFTVLQGDDATIRSLVIGFSR